MKKVKTLIAILLLGLIYNGCKEKKESDGVSEKSLKNEITLVDNKDDQKVDVLVDGNLFTSYLYAGNISVLKKTTLYPIVAANGEVVTRGFPMDPRPNERTDHPHHIGAWFNYGDVNGLDYWGHSDATPKENQDRMGTIRHEKIVAIQDGNKRAELKVNTSENNQLAWAKNPTDVQLGLNNLSIPSDRK